MDIIRKKIESGELEGEEVEYTIDSHGMLHWIKHPKMPELTPTPDARDLRIQELEEKLENQEKEISDLKKKVKK